MKKRFFNRRQLKKFEVSQSTIVVIPFKILPFKSAAKKDYYFQRPGTPNRKSITSIDSRDHEKLIGSKPLLAKQAGEYLAENS